MPREGASGSTSNQERTLIEIEGKSGARSRGLPHRRNIVRHDDRAATSGTAGAAQRPAREAILSAYEVALMIRPARMPGIQ